MEVTLPPVAKSFFTLCKKCNADRYHRVLAHKTATSAKIECEICHSKGTYTLPKAQSKKTSTKTGAAKTSTRVGTAKRSHTGDYEVRVQSAQKHEGKVYSMKAKFAENDKINHPKFGIGFVIKSYDEKVDVIFSDEVRTLMHARV